MSQSILVAEDNDQVRGIIRQTLENAGYDVCEATNGEEAIRVLRSTPFDLVVTDILMPERDGLETIMYLRKQLPEVAIIAISGLENRLILDNAKGLGATRILAKPFSPSDLQSLVAELLGPPSTG